MVQHPQTIEFDAPTDLRYADLQVSNVSNATLESGLSSTNVTGNLTISSGGVFDDGGFASSFTGEIPMKEHTLVRELLPNRQFNKFSWWCF